MPRRKSPRPGRPAPTEPTPQQKRLVELVIAENRTIKELAPRAGYKDTPGGHKAAREALKLPWVKAWMLHRVRDELAQDVAGARLTIKDLAENARSEYVRLQASIFLIEHTEKRYGQAGGAQGLKININLSGQPGDAAIDVTPHAAEETPADTPGSPQLDTLRPSDTGDLPASD